MTEPQKIADFIDVKLIQKVQDNCAKAMGLAFITVDYRGIPVTEYSGFTPHCMLGRQTQGFAEMCEQCDAHGGLHAAITGQPYIYRCHADLVDFAVPLILNGSYMGAVLGGQVRLTDEEERELERILPLETNWRKNQELNEAYQKVERVSYAKLEAAVQVLRDIILYIMQSRYSQSVIEKLEGKDRELAVERAARSDLEFAIQKRELNALQRQEGFRYFFFVMNILSRLAYEEKAVQTESVAYDFADMMRYVTDPDHAISTLGEELSYIGSLLRIQKAWHREALSYSISVPERYWGMPCPFMVLQPVVECLLKGLGEAANSPREVSIFAEEEGSELLIQVRGGGETLNPEDIEAQLTGTGDAGRFSLHDADRSLRRTLGQQCRLCVGGRRDGQAGCVVSFRLPLKRGD